MKDTRSLCGTGVALALLCAAHLAQAQSRPEVSPPDPKPARLLPGSPAEAVRPSASPPKPDRAVRSERRAGASEPPILALDEKDRDLVTEAGQMGKAEVAAGRIALGRSEDPVVRRFAETVVTEHGQQYARLLGIAERGIVSLDALDATHEHMLGELREAPEADFDRAYIRMVVRGHMDSVSRLRRMALDGQDAEVRGYARQTLGIVQRHLDEAKRIDATMTRLSLSRLSARDPVS